jgi:hypothetical protein
MIGPDLGKAQKQEYGTQNTGMYDEEHFGNRRA